jgi:hypothetical protein
MKLKVIVHEAKEGDFWREVPPFLADDLTPLLEKHG